MMIWIPLLPLLVAVLLTLVRPTPRVAAGLAITGIGGASGLALDLFVRVAANRPTGPVVIDWLPGFNLNLAADPLAAGTALMVACVSLLVFIYSTGYMAGDPRAARFFAFLSLFAGAMLGLVLAGDLLALFVSWELVGLASYLLIGFWFHRPEAAAAARKAFLTTRVGDIGLFAGLIWLHSISPIQFTFFNLSHDPSVAPLLTQTPVPIPLALSLLLFLGAMAKSGQFPLHVWLPDAMEGPTPVSALIHAATMVAAGVFLVARTFPLFSSGGPGDPALAVIAWTGALTALFAALIAVAQNDIKRILAYSTISQLGFMMLALGVAGPAVAMLHLVGHAFFKALLFLGAGSVIHCAHGEQDIRRMGGLRRTMPSTFATYAVGMSALSGVPIFFCGFWSKDAILHAAHAWPISQGPFWMACAAALLTSFYMTRQMCLVFGGTPRHPTPHPQETPASMVGPLWVLALASILFSLVATPAWPWFEAFLNGHAAPLDLARIAEAGFLKIALASAALALGGIGLGWAIYRKAFPLTASDPLARRFPRLHRALENRLYIDEFYGATLLPGVRGLARLCAGLDRWLWDGLVRVTAAICRGLSISAHGLDEAGINDGVDRGCAQLHASGARIDRAPGRNAQSYLRWVALGVAVTVAFLLWIR